MNKQIFSDLLREENQRDIFYYDLDSYDNTPFNQFCKTLFNEGSKYQKQVFNMLGCKHESIWLNNDTYNVDIQKTCDNRFHPECSKRRAIKHSNALQKFFKKAKKEHLSKCMRFLTLTYKSVKTRQELKHLTKQISKDMTKFRFVLKKMGYLILNSYRVLEVTWNEKEGFHPHLHILYFSKVSPTPKAREFFSKFVKKHNVLNRGNKLAFYDTTFFFRGKSDGFIDYNVLKSIWQYSNHTKSHVCRPQVIKYGLKAGISYITKYMTKGFFNKDLPTDVLVDLYIATSSVRYIQKSGIDFKQFSVKDYNKVAIYFSGDTIFNSNTGKYEALKQAIPFTYGLDYNLDLIDRKKINYIEVEI